MSETMEKMMEEISSLWQRSKQMEDGYNEVLGILAKIAMERKDLSEKVLKRRLGGAGHSDEETASARTRRVKVPQQRGLSRDRQQDPIQIFASRRGRQAGSTKGITRQEADRRHRD